MRPGDPETVALISEQTCHRLVHEHTRTIALSDASALSGDGTKPSLLKAHRAASNETPEHHIPTLTCTAPIPASAGNASRSLH